MDERTVMEQIAAHAGALAWRSAVAVGGTAAVLMSMTDWQFLVGLIIAAYGMVQTAVYFVGMFRPFGFVEPPYTYPTAEEIAEAMLAMTIPGAPATAPRPEQPRRAEFVPVDAAGHTLRRQGIGTVVEGLSAEPLRAMPVTATER